MILFVFEGGKAEPKVFESLRKLYLVDEEVRTVSCEHDLPTLYSYLKKNDYDLFRSLPLRENGIEIPDGVRMDTMFSQIFLFFDYDFQNHIGLEKVNEVLTEMLDFFDDETENGKLYINYPMVESLKYTKEMPDAAYNEYVTTRKVCSEHKFKSEAEAFAYSAAKGYRFIDLDRTSEEEVLRNWELLKEQNVKKANFLCNDADDFPEQKEDIAQGRIFESQLAKYVEVGESVAILNSFPIFVYEYLRRYIHFLRCIE